MKVLLVFLVIGVANAQLDLNNAISTASMPQITGLDVQCEKTGMTVNLQFSAPFNGIIFSKGHFSDPSCRYVTPGNGQTSYTFLISMRGCGTFVSESSTNDQFGQSLGGRTFFTNTIIVQMDDTIQEIWDTARRIRCDWINQIEKTVNFSPFAVEMLDAVEMSFTGDDTVDCWMDLQLGIYPDSAPITSIVRIGETISLLVFAKDDSRQYELRVRDCFAFSDPDFFSPETTALQLTDRNGCSVKQKLIDSFMLTRESGPNGETIVAVALMSAFKFPDKMEVYTSCNIEICKDSCGGDFCDVRPQNPTTPEPFLSGSTLYGEPQTTTQPPPTTTFNPCYPGSPDPQCQPPSQQTQPPLPPPTQPPPPPPTQPPPPPPTQPPPPPPTQPPPAPPTQPPEQLLVGLCYPGNTDPRCPQLQPQVTVGEVICYPGTVDPRCPPIPVVEVGSLPDFEIVNVAVTPAPLSFPPNPSTIFFIPPEPSTPAPPLAQQDFNSDDPHATGESRYHAFHQFHFDKGDGRRSRNGNFGRRNPRRRSQRSAEEETHNEVRTNVARLVRSVHVLSPVEFPELDQTVDFQIQTHDPNSVCMSVTTLASGAMAVGVSVLIIVAVISFFLTRRYRSRYHPENPPLKY